MSKIKIKLWHKEKKVMYEPDVIDLFLDCEGNIFQQVFSNDEQHVVGFKQLSNDDFTIIQSTGLKDKNGKELYPSDIVKAVATGKIGLILDGEYEYDNEEHCGFYISWLPIGKVSPCGADSKVCLEKIGNIYKTPELLHE